VGPTATESRSLAPFGFTAAVAAGLSVRLWKAASHGPSEPAGALLWDQTRVDVLSVTTTNQLRL
jgi:hypothetical protein